jgi:hypothetical protein
MKTLLAASVFALCFSAAAIAQEEGAPPAPDAAAPAELLPVESMNCEQMQAELMVAGQRMNAQMDPEFGAEAQAMQQEMEDARRRAAGSVAANIGMGLACSIPGVGMACMAGQVAQQQQAQQQAAQNQARMDAQVERLNQSMAGLDQNRLMALSQRYEAQHCQNPQ